MRCSAGFYPAQATGWTVPFSGTEAQLRLQMEEYDLLLLDLMLPGLAGEELIAWLRAEKMMPVIVLSAKAGLDARVNALRLGADDFIQKPFENEEVLARVEAQLRRCRLFSPAQQSHRLHYRAANVGF